MKRKCSQAAQDGEKGDRGMEVGPCRSFYTELVLAFTGLRPS